MGNNGASPPPPYEQQLGPVNPPKDDPAWAPPRDPLKNAGDVRKSARVFVREIPLITIQTSWTITNVRNALAALPSGQFSEPAQLVDTIIGDDRVQSALASRIGGLASQPLKFQRSTLPGVDEGAAKDCLDAWKRIWPKTMTEPVLAELGTWGIFLRLAPAQLLWDTSEEIWCPYVRPFHPRYTFWHWELGKLIAVTRDGLQAITAGDGHWLLHAPHGEYRGWMHGAVRAIAQPWFIRQITYRDHARWSERHGFPMTIGETPAAADDVDRTRFLNQLAALGQESVIEAPQGVDKGFSYGVELLEAKDGAWQGFTALIQQCEASITLALLGQNLTTEVKEGSFAAARVHADVRQSLLQSDARALAQTIYTQIARPFAAINFGDPDLAPMTTWDLRPYEDLEVAAKTFLGFSQAVFELRRAGYKFDLLDKIASDFGISLEKGQLTEAEPLTTSGGGAGAAGGGAGGGGT